VTNKNLGDFKNAIKKHETCTRLDPWTKSVVATIQKKHFNADDELNFDLDEFLDFNKVPGLEDSEIVTSSFEDLAGEVDLT
jgi:hypothetical protein